MISSAGSKAPAFVQGANNCSPLRQCNVIEGAQNALDTVLALLLPFVVPAKDVCRHAACICLSPHKQADAKTSEDVDHLPSHLNNQPHNGMVDYTRHTGASYDVPLSSHANFKSCRRRFGGRGYPLGDGI